MKEIHIRPILNGFILKVGCQELVFEKIQVLANELVRYQKNPKAVEKEYLDKAVNKIPPSIVTEAPQIRRSDYDQPAGASSSLAQLGTTRG